MRSIPSDYLGKDLEQSKKLLLDVELVGILFIMSTFSWRRQQPN